MERTIDDLGYFGEKCQEKCCECGGKGWISTNGLHICTPVLAVQCPTCNGSGVHPLTVNEWVINK